MMKFHGKVELFFGGIFLDVSVQFTDAAYCLLTPAYFAAYPAAYLLFTEKAERPQGEARSVCGMAPKVGPAEAFLARFTFFGKPCTKVGVGVGQEQVSDSPLRPLFDFLDNAGMMITCKQKGELMHAPQPDWRRNKMAQIYLSYHSAIRARSGEGQPYIMRAFYAVLVLRRAESGAARSRHGNTLRSHKPALATCWWSRPLWWTWSAFPGSHPEMVLRRFSDIPYALRGKYEPFLFNFGSAEPQGYPGPMDETLWNTFSDPDLDESLPKFRDFLTHNPILIGEYQ